MSILCPPPPHPSRFGGVAIEAAQLRLSAAERWAESSAALLASAQSQVEEAREYLRAIERRVHANKEKSSVTEAGAEDFIGDVVATLETDNESFSCASSLGMNSKNRPGVEAGLKMEADPKREATLRREDVSVRDDVEITHNNRQKTDRISNVTMRPLPDMTQTPGAGGEKSNSSSNEDARRDGATLRDSIISAQENILQIGRGIHSVGSKDSTSAQKVAQADELPERSDSIKRRDRETITSVREMMLERIGGVMQREERSRSVGSKDSTASSLKSIKKGENTEGDTSDTQKVGGRIHSVGSRDSIASSLKSIKKEQNTEGDTSHDQMEKSPEITERPSMKRRDREKILSVRGTMLQRMESFSLASTPLTTTRKEFKKGAEVGAGAKREAANVTSDAQTGGGSQVSEKSNQTSPWQGTAGAQTNGNPRVSEILAQEAMRETLSFSTESTLSTHRETKRGMEAKSGTRREKAPEKGQAASPETKSPTNRDTITAARAAIIQIGKGNYHSAVEVKADSIAQAKEQTAQEKTKKATSTVSCMRKLLASDQKGVKEEALEDDEMDPSASIKVSDCGVPEANGKYHRFETSDGVPSYSKVESYEGHEALFTISRRDSDTGTFKKWYVTATVPGREREVVFYAAHARGYGRHPPRDGWTVVGDEEGRLSNEFEERGVPPAPVISQREPKSNGKMTSLRVEGKRKSVRERIRTRKRIVEHSDTP